MKNISEQKIVYAEPMAKKEAAKEGLLRNPTPAERDSDAEGYKVLYEDGYKSWSPANAFNAAYKPAENAIQRLKIERDETLSRLEKLNEFRKSSTHESLSTAAKAMLAAQGAVMSDYVGVMDCRLTEMEAGIGGLCDQKFSVAIALLENGFAVRRNGWNGKGLIVFKQVPASIQSDIIPKMQSLPDEAKKFIQQSAGHIDYTSQCLIYNTKTGRADSWVPSISDVFANDWELVLEVN